MAPHVHKRILYKSTTTRDTNSQLSHHDLLFSCPIGQVSVLLQLVYMYICQQNWKPPA